VSESRLQISSHHVCTWRSYQIIQLKQLAIQSRPPRTLQIENCSQDQLEKQILQVDSEVTKIILSFSCLNKIF